MSKTFEEARRLALKNLAEMTDEEDASLNAAALADPDNPPRRRLGRPPAAVRKQVINIRLDSEVVEAFKADGDGWQTRMNDALRKAAGLR